VVSVISAFRNPFADPSLPALANGAQLGHLRQQAQHPIDSLVLDGLRHQLMAPELVDECTATYHEEVNRQRAGLARDRNRKQQEVTAIERRQPGQQPCRWPRLSFHPCSAV
jgi:hypothetical protein